MIFLDKTKTRKQYLIPLSSELKSVLKTWLRHRKHETDEDFLFSTVYNLQLPQRSLNQSISVYNKARNVNKSGIHTFRHTFAKNWISNGGDIFRLQKILGHSSMEMVKNYVNMFSHDLAIDFDLYNPYDNFKLANIKKKALKL